MKYRIQVDLSLSTFDQHGYGGSTPLRLQETSEVELKSLSDAAEILVKLHEFFEEVNKGKK